jgi:hypothetical protein
MWCNVAEPPPSPGLNRDPGTASAIRSAPDCAGGFAEARDMAGQDGGWRLWIVGCHGQID